MQILSDSGMKEIRDFTRFLALSFDAVLIPLQSIPGGGLSARHHSMARQSLYS